MCFGTAPVRAAEPIPQLNGLTVSYDENASILPGLWAMPTGNGGNWTLKFYMNPADCTFYSGVAYEDTYYATRYTTAYGTVMTYVVAFAMDSDPEAGWGDWTNTHDATFLPFDLTYNPYDHRIYGFFSNAATDGVVYATVEYEHGSKSRIHPIKNMDDSWVAIAAAPDGTIYGIAADVDRTSGSPLVTGSALYKIDRLTGDASFIGATGQKPLLTGSATIDPRSGRMFWTVGPSASESYLCEVDLATGAATKLYDFTESRCRSQGSRSRHRRHCGLRRGLPRRRRQLHGPRCLLRRHLGRRHHPHLPHLRRRRAAGRRHSSCRRSGDSTRHLRHPRRTQPRALHPQRHRRIA